MVIELEAKKTAAELSAEDFQRAILLQKVEAVRQNGLMPSHDLPGKLVPGQPRVFDCAPKECEPGTTVTISGQNLIGARALIGGRPARILESRDARGSVPIGSTVIPHIPAGEYRLAMVEWTPSSSHGNHVCVQASIEHQLNELNASNNLAQENLVDWYISSASPYEVLEVPFQVRNPLPYRAHFRLDVHGPKPGYAVDLRGEDLDFWLKAGEEKRSTRAHRRRTPDSTSGRQRVPAAEGVDPFPAPARLRLDAIWRHLWPRTRCA